jgi:adenylate cyclase
MPRLRKVVGLGAIIAVIGIGSRPTALGVRLEEDLGLRWLFTLRGPLDAPRGVVVISIDKTSSDQLGLKKEEWPPPRHVHASVIRSLSRHGVSAIMMDVFFRVHRTAAEDDDFTKALTESGRVTLFESVDRIRYRDDDIIQTRSPIEPFRNAALATAAFPLPEGPAVTFFWTFFDATAGKVPTLPAVALQILALPQLDRFTTLVRQAGVSNLTDLPIRMTTVGDLRQLMKVFRRELGSQPDAARRTLTFLDGETTEALTAAQRDVLSSLVRLYAGDDTHYLNFYGPPGRIRTIPFHELLADSESSRLDLKGTVAFVGEGASGLLGSTDQRDTYRTIYSEDGLDLSGAEIAATAFANLLTNRTLRRVRFGTEVGILVCFALLAAILARALPVLSATGAILALGGAYVAIAEYLFTAHTTLVPVGIPLLLQVPVSLFAAVLFRYRDVRRQVPKEVDPGAPPELVQGVCLSTDIENYVAASASMEPGDLARLMSEYYETLARLVARRRGLMMGRAGDSVMCVWTGSRRYRPLALLLGTRIARERLSDMRARVNACQTALDIRETIDGFNERHATPLRTRIGLHVGEAAMGLVGGEYHVIGDVPNSASRIEGLNKQLGTTILASESVVLDLEGLCLRPLGRFILVGRPGELAVVEIVGRSEAVAPSDIELCQRFASALAVFTSGDLVQAGSLFQAIASNYPSDGPTRYYQRLCSGHPAVTVPASGPPVIRIEMK